VEDRLVNGDSSDSELNPIVALAHRLRTRRQIESAIDSATPAADPAATGVLAQLDAFALALAVGAKRLNSILGREGVTFVRLEKPLRIRLRFRKKRVRLDIDEARQLVVIAGEGLDGEYQFEASGDAPALINLSKLSTEPGYGAQLTPNALLKKIAEDAELPRPGGLEGLGPLQF
jgi:hypothetical protein